MVNFCYGEKNVFLDVLGSFWSTKTRKTTFLCMLLFSKGHNRRDNRSRSILDLNPIQEHHWNLHGLNIYKTKQTLLQMTSIKGTVGDIFEIIFFHNPGLHRYIIRIATTFTARCHTLIQFKWNRRQIWILRWIQLNTWFLIV